MNERIIEFRKQCITEVKDEHGNWINYHFDESKFAELIVRECIDTVLDSSVEYTTRPQVAEELKEHFGVE
jgi:hypothetical protein